VRIVDMSSSNAWAEFAGLFRSTRSAYLEHEKPKSELKSLMLGGRQGGDWPSQSSQSGISALGLRGVVL
jgi:hypothetical protein